MADPVRAPSPDHDDWDVFDLTEEEDMRRDAEAIAQADAGKLIPHDEVVEWLKTWGTPEETPAPKRWFE